MAVDRDLHVAVVTAWGGGRSQPASAWEMLAATGVRGLRVLVESGALGRLLSTEAGGPASVVLEANAARYADRGARAHRWDARRPPSGGPFDLVDLDPFGSPLPFLDSAFDALAVGGLLSVTATDMIVLAGVDADATRRRYHATPVRGRLGPEAGLRILLRTLSDRAAARGRAIHPLVAYVRDHYVRSYVLVGDLGGAAPVGEIDAERWDGPPLGTRAPVGPMWLGPLFDRAFVERLQVPAQAARAAPLTDLLARFGEESVADVPFYYESNTIARDTRLPAPPSTERLIEALRAHGHPSGRTHARAGAFRTTAVRSEVYALAVGLAKPSRPPAARGPDRSSDSEGGEP
jgi:tRNA (guanine26-N2/guanine27-N2)-dimethyltransferase